MLKHERIQESLVHGERPAYLSIEDLRGCGQMVSNEEKGILSVSSWLLGSSPSKLTRPRLRVHSEKWLINHVNEYHVATDIHLWVSFLID